MKDELTDEQILHLLRAFKTNRRPTRFYSSQLYPYTAEIVALFYQGASYTEMKWYLESKSGVCVVVQQYGDIFAKH
jgi:hypothetical protein